MNASHDHNDLHQKKHNLFVMSRIFGEHRESFVALREEWTPIFVNKGHNMEIRIHTCGGSVETVETFFPDSPALVARILKGIRCASRNSEGVQFFGRSSYRPTRGRGTCVRNRLCLAALRQLPSSGTVPAKGISMKQKAVQNVTATHKHLLRVVSGAAFESEVLRSKGPALVMFWAPWSHPCQVMDSVLIEVARACARRAKVVKVNADDNPDLSLWYGVQSIPTLLHFIDGKLSQRIVGTVSKKVILELLRGGRDAAMGVRPCEKGHDA